MSDQTKNQSAPGAEEQVLEPMSDAETQDLFFELAQTKFWQAIKGFNYKIDSMALSQLAALDPFKKPTEMARTQGIRNGLYYLENEVNRILKKRAKNETQDQSE